MPASSGLNPDRVLTNARIFTGNEVVPWAEAVIIRDGHLSFVGSAQAALARARPSEQVHDLGGQFVLPGFVDAHTHPGMIGFLGEETEESPIPKGSHAEIMAWLNDYAGWFSPLFVQAGEWPTTLYGIEGPMKQELDRVVRWRPVLLFDDSGHSQWLNTSALRLLGIDASTPDPAPGLSYFERDEAGEPTGWAKEFALIPFVGDSFLPNRLEMKRRIAVFLDFLSSKGVTTLFDAGNLTFHREVYSILAELESEGRLPLRYFGSVHVTFPVQLDTAVGELLDLRRDYGSDLLRFETIKIHYDGVQEIRTAAMLEPYLGAGAGSGATLVETDRLSEFILELHDVSVDLHLHTVGDRAVRSALDAVEQARRTVGEELNSRVALSHVEVLADEDIPRFGELGVTVNFTPHWYGGYFEGAHLTTGPPRSDRMHRVRSMIESGANVSFSSDVTTYAEMGRAAPFFGMQIASTRQEVGGGSQALVMSPEAERVDVVALIRGYTLGGAVQLGLEQELGTIQEGMAADLVVLSENPLTAGQYQLHEVEATAVLVQGRVVSGSLR